MVQVEIEVEVAVRHAARGLRIGFHGEPVFINKVAELSREQTDLNHIRSHHQCRKRSDDATSESCGGGDYG